VEPLLLLSELLSTERVRVPLGSHSKADLLRELVHLALPGASQAVLDGVIAAVEAREADISTAMGAGLAVPHGRTDLVKEVCLSAGLAEGVSDYDAPDGVPVRVAFLVLTPVRASSMHVKLLSRIARVMHDRESRAALLSARTADEFVGVMRRADAARAILLS
jgi:mannitol/fructose-specific phosphotransferase system IIA component (Ntr-type)